jgi:hypothetical protein
MAGIGECEQEAPGIISVSEPANTISSRLTFTGRAENTGQLVSDPGRMGNRLNAALSQHFRSLKAWASKVTSAIGRTCFELAIENCITESPAVGAGSGEYDFVLIHLIS